LILCYSNVTFKTGFKMTSFYSERTAEYTLVPAFQKILNPLGESIPIYFWKTREGNTISNTLHGDNDVYLIAFFARRPKINPNNRNIIQGKINYQLFEFSKQASKWNVPVFCGLSLTTDIFQLSQTNFLWFHIDSILEGIEPIFNIENNQVIPINDDAKWLSPLSESSIIDIVQRTSKKIPWSMAVERMTELYRQSDDETQRHTLWFTRNWIYKPMYFLVR